MARRRNTGILDTNFPSTVEEVFRVSQYNANPNPMAKVEACEMRALTAMRLVWKGRKTRQRRAGSVKIDNLKRPTTYPRSREDHRLEREEFLARNLPENLRKDAGQLTKSAADDLIAARLAAMLLLKQKAAAKLAIAQAALRQALR